MNLLVSSPPILRSSVAFVDRMPDLVSIFDDEINVAVLRRTANPGLAEECRELASKPGLNLKMVVDANAEGRLALRGAISSGAGTSLIDDIFTWVELIAEITGAEAVGVRLMQQNQAMCPKLHVDHVSLRLVTAYQGPGTQFASQHLVRRSRLGHASAGLADEDSGILLPGDGIYTAQTGDVVLLKGEAWPDNAGRGAVHRSPPLRASETRVVLTLDPL